VTLPFSALPRTFLGCPVQFVRETGATALLGVFHARFKLASFGCQLDVNTSLEPPTAQLSVFKRPGDPLFTITGRGALADLETAARVAFVDLATRTTEAARLIGDEKPLVVSPN